MPTATRRRRRRRRFRNASPLTPTSPALRDGTIATANTMPMGIDDDGAAGSPGNESPPAARTRRGRAARERSCGVRRSARVAAATPSETPPR